MPHRNWLLLVILAGLVGFGWYLNQRDPQQPDSPATPAPTEAFLWADETRIVKFRLSGASGEYTQLERGQDGAWMVETAAASGTADQASSEMAASQVGSLRIINTLDAPPALQAIGLDNPQYTLTVTDNSGEQVFRVGAVTLTGSGYYVLDSTGNVSIVSKFGLDALLTLLAAPPFGQTPIPNATTAP